MRYGSEKAGLGPGVDEFTSRFELFDSLVAVEGGGGGSITEGAGEGFERGSGRDGIGSSADDVSIVMFLVVGGDWRRV